MSRKPDWDIKAMRKDTDEKSRIGAGWNNPDGSISIVLSPFIVLSSHKELLITAFSAKEAKP